MIDGSSWSEERQARGSDRSFGLVFAAVSALLAILAFFLGSTAVVAWLAIAAVFLAAAILLPGILSPLNRLWTWLGRVLFAIMNPVITAVLFSGVFMPVGLAMRAFGNDPLRRRMEPQADSYWIERGRADARSSMKNQF